MGPVWVRTLVLKSGLSPESGLFKKTDFPSSLTNWTKIRSSAFRINIKRKEETLGICLMIMNFYQILKQTWYMSTSFAN